MARKSSKTSSGAVLYLRLSRQHDASTESLASQERKLRERAKAERLKVREVYNEGAGRSAFKETTANRPEWMRLVSELEPGDVVMAVETSRVSRKVEVFLRELRRIKERGAHLVTLDGNDSRQDASSLPLTVRAAVAEEESRLKSERAARAKDRLRKAGRWLGGRPPYGYVLRDGKLRRDRETAPIVRRAALEVIDGWSLVAIARGLNAEGVPAPYTADAWRQSSLSAILRNPVNVGYLPIGRDGSYVLQDDGTPVMVVEGKPILTTAERSAMLAALKSRTRDGWVPRGAGRQPKALASNVLRCGLCGAPMRPAGASYYCHDRKSGGACSGMTVTVARADECIATAVLGHLAALDPDDPEELETLAEVAARWVVTRDVETDAAATEARKEVTEVEERLAELDEARYVRGAFKDDAAVERYEKMRSSLISRADALRPIAAQSADGVPNLGPLLDLAQSREAWETTPLPVRQDLVRSVLASVTVAPAPSKGVRFTPERLSYTWA